MTDGAFWFYTINVFYQEMYSVLFRRHVKVLFSSPVRMCMKSHCNGLVGCFDFNGSLRQYFSLNRLTKRGRKKRERIDESENV